MSPKLSVPNLRAFSVPREAIDKEYRAYGQHWDLTDPAVEARFVWLVRRVIDPLGMHFALPCGKWGTLGGKPPDDGDLRLASLTIDGLNWQAERGALGSFEGPKRHALRETANWKFHFGTLAAPIAPWEYCEVDGCCVGAICATGEPTMKSYVLMANFSLAGLHGLQCRNGWQIGRRRQEWQLSERMMKFRLRKPLPPRA